MYIVVPEETGQQERAGQGGRMSAAVRDNNVVSQSATSGIDHAASDFVGHPADLLVTTAATIVARALPRDCARRPAP